MPLSLLGLHVHIGLIHQSLQVSINGPPTAIRILAVLLTGLWVGLAILFVRQSYRLLKGLKKSWPRSWTLSILRTFAMSIASNSNTSSMMDLMFLWLGLGLLLALMTQGLSQLWWNIFLR